MFRRFDDLRPGTPWIAQRGIERIRPRQQAMDLVEHQALGLEGRRPPADVEPHEAERPVEQRLRVDRVGPPGRDVDRDASVGDGSLEPGVIARPQRGRDRAVEREPHAVGRSTSIGAAPPSVRPVPRRRPSEPAEIGALGRGSIGKGRRGGSSGSSGRSGSTRPHEIDWSISIRSRIRPMSRWYPGPSAAVSTSAVTRPASVAVRTMVLAAGCSAGLQPALALGRGRALARAHEIGVSARQPRFDIGQ